MKKRGMKDAERAMKNSDDSDEISDESGIRIHELHSMNMIKKYLLWLAQYTKFQRIYIL